MRSIIKIDWSLYVTRDKKIIDINNQNALGISISNHSIKYS